MIDGVNRSQRKEEAETILGFYGLCVDGEEAEFTNLFIDPGACVAVTGVPPIVVLRSAP